MGFRYRLGFFFGCLWKALYIRERVYGLLHITQMSNVSQLACSYCRVTFNNQADLSTHILSHDVFQVQTFSSAPASAFPPSFSSSSSSYPQALTWVHEPPSYIPSSDAGDPSHGASGLPGMYAPSNSTASKYSLPTQLTFFQPSDLSFLFRSLWQGYPLYPLFVFSSCPSGSFPSRSLYPLCPLFVFSSCPSGSGLPLFLFQNS